jgi:hypothetical protein
VDVYRKSFEQFWNWALMAGVKTDPASVDYAVVNEWTECLLVAPATRNGRPILTLDAATGNRTRHRAAPRA